MAVMGVGKHFPMPPFFRNRLVMGRGHDCGRELVVSRTFPSEPLFGMQTVIERKISQEVSRTCPRPSPKDHWGARKLPRDQREPILFNQVLK
jgi:hypothetical protein